MKMRILKAGILVSIRSHVTGGVRHTRTVLDDTLDGAKRTVSAESKTVVQDIEEHARAEECRRLARREISQHCKPTPWGEQADVDSTDAMQESLQRAAQIVQGFNDTARFSRVSVYAVFALTGASDPEAQQALERLNESAARQMASEIRSLLSAMERATASLDPDAIRAARNEAQILAQTLAPEAFEKVSLAIKEASENAREIVKRIQRHGESAEIVARDLQTESLRQARLSFLDFDVETPAVSVRLPGEARAVDMSPADPALLVANAVPQTDIEFSWTEAE